ncbi:MAG: cytochrome c1 [Methyloligellaceae bacterium]
MTHQIKMRTVSMKPILLGAALAASLVLPASLAGAAGGGGSAERQHWSFSGLTGHYDKGQLQRGFKVYKEVCAACHGLKYLHYRNLGEDGGPGFPEAEVKELARQAEFPSGPNDEGETTDGEGNPLVRPGLPSDSFVSPYANDAEARHNNNGALPPDLSLIAKARSAGGHSIPVISWLKDIAMGYEEGGADYLYALLTGYTDPPAGLKLPEGMSYNAAFEGHQIAMPSPLGDDIVDYSDGTPQTAQQYARDVSAFLMWAAEPKLEERKGLGIRVMIYLAILSVLLYLTKRKLWSRIGH